MSEVTTEQITQHISIYPTSLTRDELTAKLSLLSNIPIIANVQIVELSPDFTAVEVHYTDKPARAVFQATERRLRALISEKKPPVRSEGRTEGYEPERGPTQNRLSAILP
jgi:hypothetical protein